MLFFHQKKTASTESRGYKVYRILDQTFWEVTAVCSKLVGFCVGSRTAVELHNYWDLQQLLS
jgi:hypothetical protein